MLDSLRPSSRRVTLILLGVCAALILAAATVTVADNPPGIALAYLGSAALVLAFVHPWRSPKKWALLAGASLLAFIPLVALHNLLEGLAGVASAGAVQAVLQAGGVAAFLLAVMVCPAGIVVGLVGSAAMLVRGRRKPVPRPGTG